MTEFGARKRTFPGANAPAANTAAAGYAAAASLDDIAEDAFASCFSDLSRRQSPLDPLFVMVIGPTLAQVRTTCKQQAVLATSSYNHRQQHLKGYWSWGGTNPSSAAERQFQEESYETKMIRAEALRQARRAKAAYSNLDKDYQTSMTKLRAAEERQEQKRVLAEEQRHARIVKAQARAQARAKAIADARDQAAQQVEREYRNAMTNLQRTEETKQHKQALKLEQRQAKIDRANQDTATKLKLKKERKATQKALANDQRLVRKATAHARKQARAKAIADARNQASTSLAHLLGPHSYASTPAPFLQHATPEQPVFAAASRHHTATDMVLFGWEEKCGLCFIGLILVAAGLAAFHILLRPKANLLNPIKLLEDFGTEATNNNNRMNSSSYGGGGGGAYGTTNEMDTSANGRNSLSGSRSRGRNGNRQSELPPVQAISISCNSSFITKTTNDRDNNDDQHSVSSNAGSQGSHRSQDSHRSRGSRGSGSRGSRGSHTSPYSPQSPRSADSTAAERAMMERQAAIARSRLQQPSSTRSKSFQKIEELRYDSKSDPVKEQAEKENDLDEIREALARYYKSYERRNARRASHHSRTSSMSSVSTIRMPLPSMHEEPILEENEDEEPAVIPQSQSNANNSSAASVASSSHHYNASYSHHERQLMKQQAQHSPKKPKALKLKLKNSGLSSLQSNSNNSSSSSNHSPSKAQLDYNNSSHGSGSLVMPQRRLSQESDSSQNDADDVAAADDNESDDESDKDDEDNHDEINNSEGSNSLVMPQRRPSLGQASVQMSELTMEDHRHDMAHHHQMQDQAISNHYQRHRKQGHQLPDGDDDDDDDGNSQGSTVSHMPDNSVSGDRPRASPMSSNGRLMEGVAIGIPVGGVPAKPAGEKSARTRYSSGPSRPPTSLTVTVITPPPSRTPSTSHTHLRQMGSEPTKPTQPSLFSTSNATMTSNSSRSQNSFQSRRQNESLQALPNQPPLFNLDNLGKALTATKPSEHSDDDDDDDDDSSASDSQASSTSVSSMDNHFPDPMPSDDDEDDDNVSDEEVDIDPFVRNGTTEEEKKPKLKPLFSINPNDAPPAKLPRYTDGDDNEPVTQNDTTEDEEKPKSKSLFSIQDAPPAKLPRYQPSRTAMVEIDAKLASTKTKNTEDVDEEANNGALSEDDDIVSVARSTRRHYSTLTAPSTQHGSLTEWQESLQERAKHMIHPRAEARARSDSASDDSCAHSNESSLEEDLAAMVAADVGRPTKGDDPHLESPVEAAVESDMQQVHLQVEQMTNRAFSGSETSSPTSVRSLYTEDSGDESSIGTMV